MDGWRRDEKGDSRKDEKRGSRKDEKGGLRKDASCGGRNYGRRNRVIFSRRETDSAVGSCLLKKTLCSSCRWALFLG